MTRREWFILSIIFWVIIGIFVSLDLMNPLTCVQASGSQASAADIWCIFQSEMYDPFIMMFGLLGFCFFIGSWFIPDK